MKVAVIGSREFDDYNLVKTVLDDYNFDVLISGGARGADFLGKQYAIQNSKHYIEFPANWKKYGKSAGFIRNKDIVKSSDLVIAFWNGESKGTLNSIKLCEKNNIPIRVIKYNDKRLF